MRAASRQGLRERGRPRHSPSRSAESPERSDSTRRNLAGRGSPGMRRQVSASDQRRGSGRFRNVSALGRTHNELEESGILNLSDIIKEADEAAPGEVDNEVDDDDEDDEFPGDAETHRISIVCTCEEFDERKLPEELSRRVGRRCQWHDQHIFLPFESLQLVPSSSPPCSARRLRPSASSAGVDLEEPLAPSQPSAASAFDDADCRCVIFFTYGTVVMWGLSSAEEKEVLRQIAHKPELNVRPLKKEEIEKERLKVVYVHNMNFSLHNDCINLPKRLESHVSTRIGVAYALAQSTKLAVFEEQGRTLMKETAHLPQELARHGRFSLSNHALSKLVGRLFVHKSGVNLLSGVLDTPEYFWTGADTLEHLYKEVAKYLQTDDRTAAVKDRLGVISELFDMLQQRQDAQHGTKLEWIVIALVAIEGIVGLLEFLGTIGIIPSTNAPGHRSVTMRAADLITGGNSSVPISWFW